MIKHTRFIFAMLLALLIFSFTAVPIQAQAPTPTPVPMGKTLNTLRSRNQLICGVNQDLIGLGYLDPNSGDVVGLQVDLCERWPWRFLVILRRFNSHRMPQPTQP